MSYIKLIMFCYYSCCSYNKYKYPKLIKNISRKWSKIQQSADANLIYSEIITIIERPIEEGNHKCRNHISDARCETNCCPYQAKWAELLELYQDLCKVGEGAAKIAKQLLPVQIKSISFEMKPSNLIPPKWRDTRKFVRRIRCITKVAEEGPGQTSHNTHSPPKAIGPPSREGQQTGGEINKSSKIFLSLKRKFPGQSEAWYQRIYLRCERSNQKF